MSAAPESDPPSSEQQIAEKRVCSSCVGEEFLVALISKEGKDARCAYCETTSRTISIYDLANRVEAALASHYERTPNEPDAVESMMQNDSAISYEWIRSGDEIQVVIMNAAMIRESIAADVLSVLSWRHYDHDAAAVGEELPFEPAAHYAPKHVGYGKYYKRWSCFERSLRGQARFFSPLAKEFLDEIFDDLDSLTTNDGKPVIFSAGPELDISSIVRARVFTGEGDKYKDDRLEEALKFPWLHLGPPPTEAAVVGRMNARGISVFYGALDEETALAEVRPPVGSKVATARFRLIQAVRLLDFDRLEAVITEGSIFDPDHLEKSQRANFLKILKHRISKPVMPYEMEWDYLVTQVVADYLANIAKLDGVKFRSAQKALPEGHNIVLFNHASRVVKCAVPKNLLIHVTTWDANPDEPRPEYTVTEFFQIKSQLPQSSIDRKLPQHDDEVSERKKRKEGGPVLEIDLGSIKVHHIDGIVLKTKSYSVERHICKTETPLNSFVRQAIQSGPILP